MIRDINGLEEKITRGTRLDTILNMEPRDFIISKNDQETMTSPELATYIENQKSRGFANIKAFEGYYEKKWFPYTMPISDIYGLRAAFDQIRADHGMLQRHQRIGAACRNALTAAGLSLHLESGFSNTVTVFDVPEGTTAAAILDRMKKEHNIMLAGSFDVLEGQVIRIGHMGNNANAADMTGRSPLRKIRRES